MLKENVAKVEKKVEKLQEQINELWGYQVDPERLEFTERKIVELEDKSRRNKLQKIKNKNIFINEDFSHEIMELRKELWEKVKKHREEGKIAYLHYRNIAVKRRNNQDLS